MCAHRVRVSAERIAEPFHIQAQLEAAFCIPLRVILAMISIMGLTRVLNTITVVHIIVAFAITSFGRLLQANQRLSSCTG